MMFYNIRKTTTIVVAVFVQSFFSLNVLGSTIIDPDSSADLFLISNSGNTFSAFRLNTELSGEINGLVATITLRQAFRNPSSDWVNGRYAFPLPENAAIDSLSLKTGGRILRGVVKEKKAAKRTFEAAKTAGKKAGLLKQNRPNLFTMLLANIAPNSEVIATVTWVQTVAFKAGEFSLRLPTTLTPRFIPGTPIESVVAIEGDSEFQTEQLLVVDSSTGWSLDTNRVPDASEITPLQMRSSGRTGSNQFSLDLSIDTRFSLAGISSETHRLDITASPASSLRQRVRLANALAPMDRDLVIRWTPVASQRPDAAIFQQQASDGVYSLLMLVPPTKNIVQTLPREVIFIIDSSGSMGGVSIAQARIGLRVALEQLSPVDRFNIVNFNTHARGLYERPVAAIQANIREAQAFVSRLEANGGTNMSEALDIAFGQEREQGYLRQVVFITDGSVGNENELFRQIRSQLGDARLFTVGIGSAPNGYFMRGAAQFGRGIYEYIDSLDQAANKMNSLFSRINRPVMRDLKIRLPGSTVVEMYPQKIPDLYLGEPLMVLLKSAQTITDVSVSGELMGSSWTRRLNATNSPEAKGLDKLWARRKINALISGQVVRGEPVELVRPEIVKLGIEHQLLTRYTSFVVVEEKPRKPANLTAKNKFIPNLLPKGSTMLVALPGTATPANILLLLGGAIMILGIGIRISVRRKNRVVSNCSQTQA